MGGSLKLLKEDVSVILQGTPDLQPAIEQLLQKLFPNSSYKNFYLQVSKGTQFPPDILVAIYSK